MNTARSIAIADAVVTALGIGEFSQSFTARRVYSIKGELDKLSALTVLVVPQGLDQEAADRGGCMRDIRISVGVLKKLTAVGDDESVDHDEVDPLMLLVEELADFGLLIRVTDPPAPCVSVETPLLFNPDALDEDRLFMSVLTYTFRVLH